MGCSRKAAHLPTTHGTEQIPLRIHGILWYFQVGGVILVVQNSKELDVQRKVFLESMSLSVSVVKPRTSSHQAIAEALDELQVCLFVNL